VGRMKYGRAVLANGELVCVRQVSSRVVEVIDGLELPLADLAEGRNPQGQTRLSSDSVQLLAPLVPRSVQDFMVFEEHIKNARAAAGKTVDPYWYEKPAFYFSNPNSIVGPDEVVKTPEGSLALDYELEVACVIGADGQDLDPADPKSLDIMAGFTFMNDWSAGDLQGKEMAVQLGPAKGKDFATSLGPWLATADGFPGLSIGRPAARIVARVNGEIWSSGQLSDMYFTWGELLAQALANTVLRPGDVLGSGTCGPGCILELRGLGDRAKHWLRAGDVVEFENEALGLLRDTVV
jgi:fumarylacetoacetate (FAA) hydrolase